MVITYFHQIRHNKHLTIRLHVFVRIAILFSISKVIWNQLLIDSALKLAGAQPAAETFGQSVAVDVEPQAGPSQQKPKKLCEVQQFIRN